MYTNCTYSAIKPLQYGYGFIGNAKTFKTRYKATEAARVFDGISPDNRKHLSVFNTNKGYVFLAVVAHWEHPIWQQLAFMQAELANSRTQAKADKKIAIAEKKLREAHQLLGLLPPPPQQISLADELSF